MLKSRHIHKGRKLFDSLFKYRDTAVLLVLLQDEHLSDVNSQQSLASPGFGGGSLLWKRPGAVD